MNKALSTIGAFAATLARFLLIAMATRSAELWLCLLLALHRLASVKTEVLRNSRGAGDSSAAP